MPRKQTHEEFVQDIKNINPTIKIIGKYQKAKERIECSCNICNFSSDFFSSYFCYSDCDRIAIEIHAIV